MTAAAPSIGQKEASFAGAAGVARSLTAMRGRTRLASASCAYCFGSVLSEKASSTEGRLFGPK